MRKLRTLENTKPTEIRAYKKSLKHIDKFTKEDVAEILKSIQEIAASLQTAESCSLELQWSLQETISKLNIEPSNDGILTIEDINKLLTPLAYKLQHLNEEYLFTEIDGYMPVRNINLHRPLNPQLDHQILVEWLENFNSLIERAHHELNTNF